MTDDESRTPQTASDGGTEADTVGSESTAVGREGLAVARSNGSAANGTETPVDREFFLEAVRRTDLLTALRMEPATAGDLTEQVDDSRSTVHRAVRSLADHDLLEKTNGTYELTNLGEIVAEEAERFRTRTGAAAALEPFLNTIDVAEVPTEYFATAEVTRPKPRQPHRSIQRIIKLIEEASSLCMLSTVLSPIYVDAGYREMMDGMEIEAVFDEQAIQIMITEYWEQARETVESGNFELYMHDGLPFELFLFDDGMAMAAHDENGIASLLVECDAPPAIEWAEELYETHRREAESLTLPDCD